MGSHKTLNNYRKEQKGKKEKNKSVIHSILHTFAKTGLQQTVHKIRF